MEQTKQDKLIKDLLLDLASKDDKTVFSGLKRVRSKGNESIVPSLIHLIENHENEKITEEAKGILLELKSTATIPFLIQELGSNPNSETRELILNSFWHSGFNAHEYMENFVSAAVKGSYMEAFEAYTVIDNLEGPFEEENIIEAQLVLKTYFSQADDSDEKYQILTNIAKQLANYELSIQ